MKTVAIPKYLTQARYLFKKSFQISGEDDYCWFNSRHIKLYNQEVAAAYEGVKQLVKMCLVPCNQNSKSQSFGENLQARLSPMKPYVRCISRIMITFFWYIIYSFIQ